MIRHYVGVGIALFDLGVLGYFVLLNTLYVVFCLSALSTLVRARRRWGARELDAVLRSPATPGISLVVPAYNEERSIRDSVRALLQINYPQFEVIVVNDGSTDGSIAALVDEFRMLIAPVGIDQPLPTRAVAAYYRSLAYPDLMVIDKANGGKSDAINAGVNAARHPLVCVIDADSLLDEHALTHIVRPFLEDAGTVAAGGMLRTANGCVVEAGKVTSVRLSRNPLVRFQTVEYLRAFLAGRVALSAANALLIISGAFGAFRRDVLIEAGGFRTDTVGEDMEIVTRLHAVCRERGGHYRIAYQPDAVCWTEVPDNVRSLGSQRRRWERGTLQTMMLHRTLIANPRYGVVGLWAMPYYLVFEALSPILEVSGYLVTAGAIAFGVLDWRFAWLLFLGAVAYGSVISVASVLLEELSLRLYPRLSDVLVLCLWGMLENLGYRQLTSWWGIRGVIDFARNRQGWGSVTRRGFARS